ncbi:MAG: DUF1289 domain-containing protein [Rhodoferax sp.]|nr:DUF1289 domain-containing protein [Rhodoferax sp.]
MAVLNTINLIAARAQLTCATAQNVPSPCISVCRMNEASGWCEGCYRTLDEIAQWSRLDDGTKQTIWGQIEQRLLREI